MYEVINYKYCRSMTLEIVIKFNIKFPQDIIKDIGNSFDLSSERKRNSDVQVLHDNLKLKANVTYEQLLNLSSEVEKLFSPLEPHLNMLKYFYVHESEIFNIFVEANLPLKEQLTPEDLAPVLETVKGILKDMLSSVATYKDLSPIMNDSVYVNVNVNEVSKEIKIVSEFSEFNGDISTSSSAVTHFESITIFHESVKHVNSLCKFCEEFQLVKCLQDEKVLRLQKIADDMKNKEIWQAKKLCEFTENIEEVQGLLYIQSVSSSTQMPSRTRAECFKFLELFDSLNTGTKELRSFLNENNLRGEGQGRFEQLHALVTQQLQHEEYNAEVLANLFAVYYLLVPLNNPNLTFKELLEAMSRLDTLKCLAQIKAVNSNIDLIRMWFARAEVSVYLKVLYVQYYREIL